MTERVDQIMRDLTSQGYSRRSFYPKDPDITVSRTVHSVDSQVVIVYSDKSYLVAHKVGGK